MSTETVGQDWLVGGAGGVDQVHESHGLTVFGVAWPDAEGAAGDQFIDINGFAGGGPAPGSVTREFTVVPLQPYSLSFSYTESPTRTFGPASVDVAVTLTPGDGGTVIFAPPSVTKPLDFGLVPDWVVYDPVGAEFTPGAGITTLLLKFSTTAGDPDFAGMFLDAISITAIPEARAWLGLGLVGGVFGLGYAGRSLMSRRAAKAVV
jgi:hypothetical protein